MSRASLLLVAGTLVTAVGLAAQEGFSPARLVSGAVPPLSVTALGGGQVLLEVTVSPEGRVTDITPLRTTPPFTEMVVNGVRGWQFAPAENDVPPAESGAAAGRAAVPSRVLVAAVYRPPAYRSPTFGEQPQELGVASTDMPYPLSTTEPALPPRALFGGVVLLEAEVAPSGAVADLKVIQSAPPFDATAEAAARLWRFSPAHVDGRPVTSVAYILFGFPQPITGSPPGF